MSKIAIVNRTNLKNYGSVLQCYALCKAVSDLGFETEILWEQGNVSKNFDFRPMKIIKTVLKMGIHPSLIKSTIKNIKEVRAKPVDTETVKLFERFVDKYINQKFMTHKNLVRHAKGTEYLKFICGSDQVWCSTTLYVDPLMYLRFAPSQKRIAYAPSIGRNYIPAYNRRKMRKYIMGIPFVSIREEEGQRLIKELTGRDVPVVLDPTLLLEKEAWELLKNQSITKKKPYILCYFLDIPSDEIQRRIEKCAENNSFQLISIGRNLNDISDRVEIMSPPCGPKEFVSYIAEADLVITDSYHGMLFSILFERRFWAVERAYQQFDQSSRQLTILRKLELEKRYLTKCREFTLENIDYIAVNNLLKGLKERSKCYLRAAIEGN